MTPRIFDDRHCTLGEGPLWHPARGQLFWFDILAGDLMSRVDDSPVAWHFEEYVSAAGWVDSETLLIASETGLWTFDLERGRRELVAQIEADNPTTRSNDGRADPFGGFWIGTMGKRAETAAGAIYRLYRGEVRSLFTGLTVPNSICFAPDGLRAFWTCTRTRQIMVSQLDVDGWPVGDPELFLDLRADGLNPDGSIVDADGFLWNAQWGAGRVARYSATGELDTVIEVPGLHSSCPAFGGERLSTLFVTTAREHMEAPDDAQGRVYAVDTGFAGQEEHRVLL